MTDSTKGEIVAWFSLASPTGLSVASVGTPGLKDDVEDQVLTGGLTAIQQILGSEIGGSDDRFIGGSPSSRMGRIRFRQEGEDSKEMVAQFLMISSTGAAIPDVMVNLAEEICMKFTDSIVHNTEMMTEVEQNFSTLTILSTIDMFIDSVAYARKKVKVSSNDKLFDDQIKVLLSSALYDHEFSPALAEIIEKPKNYKDTVKFIQKNKSRFTSEFKKEILALLCYKNPYPVLVKGKPAESFKRAEKLVEEGEDGLKGKTGEILDSIFLQVREEDIYNIFKGFSITELNDQKGAVKRLISEHAMKRLTRSHPLMLLINPELKYGDVSYKGKLDVFVEGIYTEYDIGAVLGRMTEFMAMTEGTRNSATITGSLLKNYAMHYPTGITDHGWLYIRLILHNIQQKTGISVEEALENIDLTETHANSINSNLKTVKIPKKVSPLRITSSDNSIAEFYNATGESMTIAYQQLFNTMIWSQKNRKFGAMIDLYSQFLKDFSILSQQVYVLLNAFNILEKSKLNLQKRNLPNLQDLINTKGLKDVTTQQASDDFNILSSLWEPDNIIKAIQTTTENNQETDYNEFSDFKKKTEKELNSIQSQVQSFIQKKPEAIAKGYRVVSFDKATMSDENEFKDITAGCKDDLKEYKSKVQEMIDEIAAVAEKTIREQKKVKDIEKVASRKQKDSEKLLQSYLKKNSEITKKIEESIGKSEKALSKETGKVAKDVLKSSSGLVYAPVVVDIKKKKEFKPASIEDLYPKIMNELVTKIDYDKELPRNRFLVSCLFSITVLDKIPEFVKKRGVSIALFNPKSSDLISILLQEAHNDFSAGRDINFDDRLKEKVDEITRKKIVVIILTIVEKIKEAFLAKPIPVTVIQTKKGKSIFVNMGQISKKIDFNWLINTDAFGGRLYVHSVGDIPHLMLKLPQTLRDTKKFEKGSYNVSQFFGQAAWDKVMDDHALYIGLMEYTADILGKRTRKKYDDFMNVMQAMMPF